MIRNIVLAAFSWLALTLIPLTSTEALALCVEGYRASAEGMIVCVGQPNPVANVQATYSGSRAINPDSRRQIIPPSQALGYAMRSSPGAQGLGVQLVPGPRLLYAVKLKIGNQVHRLLVDARTGQIVGR